MLSSSVSFFFFEIQKKIKYHEIFFNIDYRQSNSFPSQGESFH